MRKLLLSSIVLLCLAACSKKGDTFVREPLRVRTVQLHITENGQPAIGEGRLYHPDDIALIQTDQYMRQTRNETDHIDVDAEASTISYDYIRQPGVNNNTGVLYFFYQYYLLHLSATETDTLMIGKDGDDDPIGFYYNGQLVQTVDGTNTNPVTIHINKQGPDVSGELGN